MPCRFGAQAGACGHGGRRERLCSGSCAGSPRMGCEIGKASPIKALILPPQPAATQIRSREWDGPLAVPAIPGVMARSWVCRWDPSLPGLGLSHGSQDTRWSPASQPLAGTGAPGVVGQRPGNQRVANAPHLLAKVARGRRFVA